MFFAPDGSGGGGGDTGNGSSGATGDTGGGGGDAIVTPFDSLDLSEFDEDTRKGIETAKKDFVATLQKSRKTEADLAHTSGLARRFQSEADRLKTELDKGKKKDDDKNVDPFLEIAKQTLRENKYTDAEIDKLAPVFAAINRQSAEVTRATLGRDLAPMAGSVLATEATQAFLTAQQQDRIGYFQIPTIAHKVWEMVTDRIGRGESTNDAIVANLGKMVYVDYLETEAAAGRSVEIPKREATPASRMSTTPPQFNYPGSGITYLTPALPRVVDPKAARTTLNEDTQNALANTFKHMLRETGVAPKAFGGGKK